MAQLQERLFGMRSSASIAASAATRRRDVFLAQLGALLSRAIRHTVVPPTSTWHEGDAIWHDPGEARLPGKVRAPPPPQRDLPQVTSGAAPITPVAQSLLVPLSQVMFTVYLVTDILLTQRQRVGLHSLLPNSL